MILACSGPKYQWSEQVIPGFTGLDSAAKVLRPAPMFESLDILKDCDSCGALSAGAVAFDHDYYADSLLGIWGKDLQICDSMCIEDLRLGTQKELWSKLAPLKGWEEFFSSLEPDARTEWQESLSPEQKRVLAYAQGLSGARYLLLPIQDSVWVKSLSGRQGLMGLKWSLSLWDLKEEKLLWAASYLVDGQDPLRGEIDRLWHKRALTWIRPFR